jgi:hypothetical protein
MADARGAPVTEQLQQQDEVAVDRRGIRNYWLILATFAVVFLIATRAVLVRTTLRSQR